VAGIPILCWLTPDPPAAARPDACGVGAAGLALLWVVENRVGEWGAWSNTTRTSMLDALAGFTAAGCNLEDASLQIPGVLMSIPVRSWPGVTRGVKDSTVAVAGTQECLQSYALTLPGAHCPNVPEGPTSLSQRSPAPTTPT
jgi:hypothetical protein